MVMPTYTPLPGTIGLSKISGLLGFSIALAQLLCGQPSPFTHAFVVLDDDTVLEAMPKGARLQPLPDRLDWTPVGWSWMVELDADQRARVVQEARALVGVPYSFLDYLAILLTNLGLRNQAIQRRVASSGHMICSQLVDEVYRRAGIQLFDDGRFSGDVMPGTIANAMVHARWAQYRY